MQESTSFSCVVVYNLDLSSQQLSSAVGGERGDLDLNWLWVALPAIPPPPFRSCVRLAAASSMSLRV
jgi:hypothetical protein